MYQIILFRLTKFDKKEKKVAKKASCIAVCLNFFRFLFFFLYGLLNFAP